MEDEERKKKRGGGAGGTGRVGWGGTGERAMYEPRISSQATKSRVFCALPNMCTCNITQLELIASPAYNYENIYILIYK